MFVYEINVEKLSVLYAMKNCVKRIVSPNHEKLQSSRDQRQYLGGTRNLRDLTTEMLKCNACFQKLFPSRYTCVS